MKADLLHSSSFTLHTFFEKFDLFADAPDAVAKMRELVLQMAVQGRLVSQSPNDEPANALAVTIAEDRAAFVKKGSLARQRVLAPVEDDQCPFALPPGWTWTRLGNLCRVQAGFAFQSAAFVQGDSGVPMIRIRDITKDHTQVNYVGEYREEFLVDAGDYLVGMDGNFTVAKWRGPQALLNQRVSCLQWYSRQFEPSFFAIAAQYRLSELQGTKAYTTVDHLSSGQIENAVVPLPPLAEQKRIVAKVDELMALCDRLEAQQQERETRHAALARASLARFADAPTPANLQFLFHSSFNIQPSDLRKSILTLAVQGKLVPQDPCDEPVFVLSNSEFDVAFDVPENWAWIRLANLQPEFQNGASSRGDKNGTPVIVIRLADIENKRISLDDPRAIAISIDQIAKYSLQFGDTLITRVNGSADIVGTFIPVQDSLDAIYCDHFIRMRIDPERLFPAFTALVGDSPLVREQIRSLFITTAGQKTVNQGHIRSLCIPLPPLAEQRRIVAKVEQLMALVDELETQLAASRATAVNLLSALVAELTAQV